MPTYDNSDKNQCLQHSKTFMIIPNNKAIKKDAGA